MKIETAEKWFVYRQDTNGVCYLMKTNLSEIDADAFIQSIEAQHAKPHKVEYFKSRMNDIGSIFR